MFRRKNTIKKRLQSLEEYLGVIYTFEDGYPEHLGREYGIIPRIKDDVKELKKGKK